ncbi:MAG: class A beta-lactamase-related serine hydrolase [Cytophagales bacterium]|nr:class A beta-lactamase-related serine hydrolase [Cytophagales bacterium]
MRIKLLTLLTFCSLVAFAQQTNKKFKKSLFKNEKLKPLLKEAQKYRIQIVYTPIDKWNNPGKTQFFNYDPEEYFYPASTVKFPAALLSLQKLKELNIDRKAKYTSNSTIPSYSSVSADSTDLSIEKFIQSIFLVSSNDAFNRLYDFLGTDHFNSQLVSKGYLNTRINHRLSITLSQVANQTTPEINLGGLYKQASTTSNKSYESAESIPIGKAHISNGERINKPMDFSAKNQFDLLDQHRMLQKMYFPETLPDIEAFDLRPEDLEFIKDYMSRVPRNAGHNESHYPDNFGKFLLYGDKAGRIPEHIKIYNKIGGAYGFLIDNALIHDEKSGIKFLLSAAIYTNENETLNDDTYEYSQIGLPFLGELGRHIYELNSK